MGRSITYHIFSLLLCCSLTQGAFSQAPNGLLESGPDKEWIAENVLVFKLKSAITRKSGNFSKAALPVLPFEILTIEPVKKITNEKGKGVVATSSILDGVYKVTIPSGGNVLEKCAELLETGIVQYAEPIFKEELLFTPSDPDASPTSGNQPYLETIKAYDAWNITKGSSSLLIGIIDTGADLDNADLQNNLYQNPAELLNGIDDDGNGYIDDRNGYDFANADAIPESDGSAHGNAVSSLAAADTDNGIGMAGVGFNTRFSPLKVFKSSNNSSSGVYDAIVYAADNGYDIVNLSLGSSSSYSQFSQDVINYAVLEKNVVVVAAAGNSNKEEYFYPASYDNVLSVAATNLDDSKSSFSTYNDKVDISAPGTSIYSAFNEVYGSDNGTSYASPMVAGVAALIKSRFPELSAKQIMERVRRTADNHDAMNTAYIGKLGSGRLNAFRAVSEGDLKSVRAKSISVSGSNGNLLFYGDSIFITLTIENILDPISNLSIALSAANNEINFLNTVNVGALNTSESKVITIVKGIIDEKLTPNSTIDIGISFSEEGYSDYQQFSVQIQPDYLDFTNKSTVLPIGGNGELARVNSGTSGAGIILNGVTVASEMGLIFSTDFDKVSDNTPTSFGTSAKSLDFQSEEFIKPNKNSVADNYSYSVFTDKGDIGLKVEQSAIAWTSLDSAIALSYRVINVSGSSITDLSAGIFSNWNLGNSNENRATWNGSDMAYTYNKEATFFAGIKILSTGTIKHSSIDIGDSNGNTQDISGDYNDSLKHRFLAVEQLTSAGLIGDGNNVAQVIGSSLGAITNNDFRTVTYLLAFGSSLSDLNKRLTDLETLHQNFKENPPIEERFFSCPGGITVINPAGGSSYNFYSDAQGTQLISSGNSLQFGPVAKDSVIYTVSTDSSYLGAIQSLPVTYVSQVANFEFTPETIFLGENQNVSSFSDKSFSPATWNWDFGNGNFASVQHPKTIYNSTGVYTTKLTVTTEQGCVGDVSKTINVAHRPVTLGLGAITICKNENVTLAGSDGQTMRVYESKEATEPAYEGSELELVRVQNDTTLYVSKFIGGLESERETVAISTKEVSPSYHIVPALDVLNSHQVWVINTTTGHSSSSWSTQDGVSSEKDTLTLSVNPGEQSFTLRTTDEVGCEGSISFTKDFTNSLTPKFDVPKVICFNDGLVITPESGTYFGFYEDSQLSTPLHKGTSFTIDSINQERDIYVVGLDNGLPGEALIVSLVPKPSNVSIVATPEILYLENSRSTQFEVDSILNSSIWYINEKFSERTNDPVFSFFEAGIFTIKVQGFDSDNCFQESTLDYVVNERAPVVLGNDMIPEVTNPYPNPVSSIFNIPYNEAIVSLTVRDVAGKIIQQILYPVIKGNLYPLDVSAYQEGVYFLEIESPNEQQSIHFIKR